MKKILIISASYYPKISEKLKKSATDVITENCTIIDVPGIFEIPLIISKNINNFDGFVALGCVIKGQTPHFELISKATIDALMNLSIEHKKPIGNGIITCLNEKQAFERAETNGKNKGSEAAKAVLSVLEIFKDESK